MTIPNAPISLAIIFIIIFPILCRRPPWVSTELSQMTNPIHYWQAHEEVLPHRERPPCLHGSLVRVRTISFRCCLSDIMEEPAFLLDPSFRGARRS